MSDKAQNTLTQAVLIPLAQAAITGGLFAALVVAGWELYSEATPMRIFWGALALGAFTTWLGAIGKWRAWIDALLGIKQSEIDEPYELRVALSYNDGQAGDFLGLPVDYKRFEQWCAGVAAGGSLGENYWTGNSNLFVKGEYHLLRAELEKRGLVQQRGRHHSSGFELTGKGRALANELARPI